MISNIGGPDSLDAVRPYLSNFFRDPDIIDIPMPSIIRERFARWLAKKREPESKAIYEKIGGKTPLTAITQKQAALLEESLNATGVDEFRVFPAMRYWHPLIDDVWREIVANGFKRLVVVTLFPFYSKSTTGSLVKHIEYLNRSKDFDGENLIIIDRYGDHPAFVKAMVEQIKRALREDTVSNEEPVELLLSAHSIPLRLIKKGDPYRDEVERSVEAIKSLLPNSVGLHLSYQSKLGPVKWLEPATSAKIDELAEKGVKHLLVYPLGFVADNSETVYEIGMFFKDRALNKGIKTFRRIGALNTDALFIDALKQIVIEKWSN
ncbi:MAG: ferrochelatase [Candidatus Latescibacteria bacterium]|nr:ferrochelatase [Candidatus Latescibacterota bacterium]NIT00785.1 ferrochelatase [Candidatus Latescibacterota bacterium]